MQDLHVGFIGLGIMGRPMAGHILRAGYPLTVYNRTRSKTQELASQGAQVGESPAEVAAESEVIITIVSDSPDVEEVVAGPRGILEGIKPHSVVIDMSTISPEVERNLDKKLRAKDCNLIDAPVSGGDVGAQKATLAIMAGGDQKVFERVRPILEVMGKSITYCGEVGCGQLTKLCNQILVSLNLLGVGEALTFARKNGLDPHVMIEAVKGGAAGSWQLSNLGPKIVERDFAPGFMVDLMQKDLRLVLEAAAAGKASLPATSLVRQLFCSAQAHGEGRQGTQILAKIIESLANLDQ
ncbi:NAD(P)-dependent oxidoreductase [Acidobacteria bacterium AH-259-L09]|nr:NAD(P)-dependent oxidoreductase [Acidobacteria bacterium AH-259-L09]